jgi:hypothetical protein
VGGSVFRDKRELLVGLGLARLMVDRFGINRVFVRWAGLTDSVARRQARFLY